MITERGIGMDDDLIARAEAEVEQLRFLVKRLQKQIRALLTVIKLKDEEEGPRSLETDVDRSRFPILDAIHRAGTTPAE